MFSIGLIINPFAGIGGRVGFKGSDGEGVREASLAKGAPKLANQRAGIALRQLLSQKASLKIYTVSGEMGESICQELGLPYEVIMMSAEPSTAQDTCRAVGLMSQRKVDLILFAGGDGTARDVFSCCHEEQMVLGIPAGVKIHSGVYAVSPQAAGLLLTHLVQGEMLSLYTADVMDIDEDAFRHGVVKARKFGYLNIPGALAYVQATKSGGREVEALVLDDIAAEIIDAMDDETYYVIGSGGTCAAIMTQLGLENTLLGSDIVYQGQLYQADAVEKDFLSLLNAGNKLRFIITVIGGQGHVLGRGNQQLSPEVVRRAGWENFELVATKSKLKELQGKPLLVDTGDPALDCALQGRKRVVTGYRDYVVYPVGWSEEPILNQNDNVSE